MDPLTPNTSAFLSYLSATTGDNDSSNNFDLSQSSFQPFDTSFDSVAAGNKNPSSLPPSAFFPIPGRDTPEDTPPSSNEANESPLKEPREMTGAHVSGSDDEAPRQGESVKKSNVNHKRKAGQGHQVKAEFEEDDEDTASDFTTGHEDKRSHQAAKGTNKKGGRKSIGSEEGKGGKDISKAAKRKEQNRAAQKAFRERREAKVKDLEEKLSELEAKSYGTSVENENLRGILKRLQEENVALRQAAFTFSMPVNGAPASGSGSNTPLAAVHQGNPSQSKPPTPPHAASDDSLRSVHELAAGGPSRKSSGMLDNGDSPDSLLSASTRSTSDSNGNFGAVNLFSNPSSAFDASALGGMPAMGRPGSASSNQINQNQEVGVSPAASNGQTELDALWATFLQQGAPQKDQSTPAWSANRPDAVPMYQASTTPASFAPNDAKVGQASGNFDKFAFRDGAAQQPTEQPRPNPVNPGQSADPWSAGNENSVDAFLASLNESANAGALDNDGGINDEDFNAQIAKILGSSNASPSDAFNLGPNPFSPTNYLNMSPSPIGPVSNGPSPMTQSGSSVSASASPESSNGRQDVSSGASVSSGSTPYTYPAGDKQIHIVDDAGKVIKPSELWIRMGMQHESNLEHLIIDDLCDMMRSKAVCKDGKAVINEKDAQQMFMYRGQPDPEHARRMRSIEERAGMANGALSQSWQKS